MLLGYPGISLRIYFCRRQFRPVRQRDGANASTMADPSLRFINQLDMAARHTLQQDLNNILVADGAALHQPIGKGLHKLPLRHDERIGADLHPFEIRRRHLARVSCRSNVRVVEAPARPPQNGCAMSKTDEYRDCAAQRPSG
jgi:hypothetical protein